MIYESLCQPCPELGESSFVDLDLQRGIGPEGEPGKDLGRSGRLSRLSDTGGDGPCWAAEGTTGG